MGWNLLSLGQCGQKRMSEESGLGIHSFIHSFYLYIYVYSSIIHNSLNMETTQVSINGQMNKQNVVYTYNGILASKRQEILKHNTDEP